MSDDAPPCGDYGSGPYRVECWLERALCTRAGVGGHATSYRSARRMADRLRRAWAATWSVCRIVRTRDGRELNHWEYTA